MLVRRLAYLSLVLLIAAGCSVEVSLLAADWGPQELALYANFWPLTPLAEGGALVGEPVLQRSLDGGQTWEPLKTP